MASDLAKQADQYGMDGNRAWQDALDKTAFEQRQIADYLDNRLADGLADLDDWSKTIADSRVAKVVGQAGGIAVDAYQIIDKLIDGDPEGASASYVGAALGGLAAVGLAAIGAPAAVVAGAAVLISWAGEELYDDAVQWLGDFLEWWDPLGIMPDVNGDYNNARNWIQRRDPLTLDLDDDGLETTGIDPNNPILFDHDGDGTANATGWVKPDDGYLVFDRNENGLIDNGTELFGDSTPLLDENGEVVGNAADGFAALAAEDTNNDGNVDAGDANWDKLRVWQDLNSDGKTDEDELKTLEEVGIAGFHVGKEENTQVLANGNAVADLGSYIRTDGSKGTLGEVTGNMADIDLIDNPFYREFSDTIPLTEQAKTLADMQSLHFPRVLAEAA
ncbi:hypothetical protein [Sedimenticola thiotaurini]|nr:hypothetical protein [Sedimenticola thiotaurini]